METKTGIQRALDLFDRSPSKLALALGNGARRQHVEHWLKTGVVPAQHCPAMQALTAVPCWELRVHDWHLIWPHLLGADGAPEPRPTEPQREVVNG